MVVEARALGRWADDPRISIGISGARPDRAEAEVRRLVDEGCRVLLSWGVAGGLDPALDPGDLVIPAKVVAEDGANWVVSPEFRANLPAGIPSPLRGEGQGGGAHLLGIDRMVLSAAEKSALFEQTGAIAVDMESQRVARVAAEAGLPAIAIRAIGDPAGRAVPRLVTHAIGEDGRPRIRPVIVGLLQRPGDIGALLQVKRGTDFALRALSGVADRVIPVVLKMN
jgi:adenosylhomocysteine nucleosidase